MRGNTIRIICLHFFYSAASISVITIDQISIRTINVNATAISTFIVSVTVISAVTISVQEGPPTTLL